MILDKKQELFPQNNEDKQLSEKEKQMWLQYAQTELSNEVLNTLTVRVNGQNKYVKDILHYNSDITAITGNAEEIIKIQIFLKKKVDNSINISGKYDASTKKAIESYRMQANLEGEVANFQKKYPQFRGLIQKFPNRFEEFKKRASLYNQLEKLKKEINFNESIELENIKKIQKELCQNPHNLAFSQLQVKTKFEGWNNQGSINYNWTGSETLNYIDYMTRLTNKNSLINELFGANIKVKKIEFNSEKQQQLSRIRVFLESMIAINPRLNMNNKSELESIYSTINIGNIGAAINAINNLTSKELNGLRVDFSTDEGLAHALRKIGDTTTAGNIMYAELTKKLESQNNSTDAKALNIFKKLYAEKQAQVKKSPQLTGLAEKRFTEMLNAIKDDPTSEYYYLIRNKEAQKKAKDGIIQLIAFDETMKNVGPTGLGDLGKSYSNMKGLGLFEMTDENWKMTKEIGIMLASMVLTAGVGALASGIGAGARALQAGRIAKAAETGSKIVRGGNIVMAKGLSGVARGFELTAHGMNALNKIPVIGNASVFTTVDIGLKGYFKDEGELVTHLDDFAKNLVTNSAMFGIFHGVGKISEGIIGKLGIQNAFKQFSVLSAGDVAGMYVFNLIETGNYTPTPEEWAKIMAEAMGFRGLIKGIEKLYPKIYAKISAINEKSHNKMDGIIDDGGVRRSTGVADKSTLERNMSDEKLPIEARMKEAERLLGRSLTSEQKIALIEAHNMEYGKNVAKGKRLMREGFTKEEAQILMDKGIAGKITEGGFIKMDVGDDFSTSGLKKIQRQFRGHYSPDRNSSFDELSNRITGFFNAAKDKIEGKNVGPRYENESDISYNTYKESIRQEGIKEIKEMTQDMGKFLESKGIKLLDHGLTIKGEAFLSGRDKLSSSELVEIKQRIQVISKDIGKIDSRSVVATPAYIKEDLIPLIDALVSQKGEFHSVIYINAHKGVATTADLQAKIKEVQDYISTKKLGYGKKISVVGNLYTSRQTIGTIRADMLDAISSSINKSIQDPLIIGLDADTYKLSKGYIKGTVDKFDANPNASYVRGQLRWTDSTNHNYAHLSERLMQSQYSPMHEQKSGYINSSGGSTSYRLKSYRNVGGYDRNAKVGEDTGLGEALKNQGEGFVYGGKVNVSPRRGEQALQEGRKFQDQWDENFKPVDEASIDRTAYKRIDDIVLKFKLGGELSRGETIELLTVINGHIAGNHYALNKFTKFWNINAKNSAYKLQVQGDELVLINKNSGEQIDGLRISGKNNNIGNNATSNPTSNLGGNSTSNPTSNLRSNATSNPTSNLRNNPTSNSTSNSEGNSTIGQSQLLDNSLRNYLILGGAISSLLVAAGIYSYVEDVADGGVAGESLNTSTGTPNVDTNSVTPNVDTKSSTSRIAHSQNTDKNQVSTKEDAYITNKQRNKGNERSHLKYDLSQIIPVMAPDLQGITLQIGQYSNVNLRNNDKIVGKIGQGDSVKLTGNTKEANGTLFVEIEGGNYVAKKYLVTPNISLEGSSHASENNDSHIKDSTQVVGGAIEMSNNFDYDELRRSIQNYNDNEFKFIFPDGIKYFGDNFAAENFSGFAILRGREDFRVVFNKDGSFVVFDTTGIDYHDIGEKATKIHTGTIQITNGKYDLSNILPPIISFV